jgi:phosphoribosyl 1,2-cyclic phosphodiesterase
VTPLRVINLASGSKGNATILEADGVRILIDCGVSFSELSRRMQPFRIRPQDVDAVLITHDHSDHIAGLPTFARRCDCPILFPAGLDCLFDESESRTFVPGRRLGLTIHQDLDVLPVAIPHDCHPTVAFVVYWLGKKFVYMTDLGHVTDALLAKIDPPGDKPTDLLLLEANHDVRMLAEGPYPQFLKERIRSRNGHLSNDQSLDALSRMSRLPKAVMFGHLSEENNRPRMVAAAFEASDVAGMTRVLIASQHEATVVARV